MSTATICPEDTATTWSTDVENLFETSSPVSRELARQRSVVQYGLAGSDAWRSVDPALQKLVEMGRELLDADYLAIHILDGDQQWAISGSPGAELSVSVRADSLCSRILKDWHTADIFVTSNASAEPLLMDSPMVNSELASISSYSAAPLVGRDGCALGTICMLSQRRIHTTAAQQDILLKIRDAVMGVLDARRNSFDIECQIVDTRGNRGTGTLSVTPLMIGSSSAERALDIHSVIAHRSIRTVFQPVVHLDSGAVVGFEALSRGPEGTELESPLALLDAAARVGRLGELDWVCRIQALNAAAAADLHPNLSWLINVEPAGLAVECPAHLRASYANARAGLRVILEVVERDVEGHVTQLLHATDQARRDSWGVALDDVGAEEGSLALLPFLRPDVVKLDMSLVRGVPRRAAAVITSAVRSFAERTGAVILAEGIETAEQESLAKVFGATYGQGYLYGRPGQLPHFVPSPRHIIPLRQRLAPLAGGTPFEVLSASVEPQRAAKSNLLHISEHLEDQGGRAEEAAVLLACFQQRRYFTAKKMDKYTRLSESNALTVVLAEGMETTGSARYQTASPRNSRIGQEWVVIVISPHYAAALVARDCGDTGPDAARQFDFIYTHDRDAVVLAARSFLQELPH